MAVGSRKMKFYIKDFGCKVNQYDARVIAKNLSGMGNISVPLDKSDIVLVNTCSVTHRASRDGVKYVRKIRQKFPKKEVVAVGCLTRDKFETANLKGIKNLPDFKYLDNPRIILNEFYGHTRAFIKVQQGCRGRCSYCNVKNLKRPYFIKPPVLILEEIKNIARSHPEIVLCATNFNEYTELPRLVQMLQGIKENFRWRFSSIHPMSLTLPLLKSVCFDEKFCRHFHIPVQSASDNVLKKMRRGYTLSEVIKVIKNAKKIMNDVVFSFDIMVGFPGETDEDFNKTINFIEEFSPVKVHVFRYSQRGGTPAADYACPIPEKIKRQRMLKIKKVVAQSRRKHFKESLGSIKEIVLETGNSGYTRDYIPVEIINSSSRIYPTRNGHSFSQSASLIKRVNIIGFNEKNLLAIDELNLKKS